MSMYTSRHETESVNLSTKAGPSQITIIGPPLDMVPPYTVFGSTMTLRLAQSLLSRHVTNRRSLASMY